MKRLVPNWPWRLMGAGGLFVGAFGLLGAGFGITFLRQDPPTLLSATLGFLLWGMAGLCLIGAARLSKTN